MGHEPRALESRSEMQGKQANGRVYPRRALCLAVALSQTFAIPGFRPVLGTFDPHRLRRVGPAAPVQRRLR